MKSVVEVSSLLGAHYCQLLSHPWLAWKIRDCAPGASPDPCTIQSWQWNGNDIIFDCFKFCFHWPSMFHFEKYAVTCGFSRAEASWHAVATHFHASPCWSPSPSSSRAASEDSRRCESPNKLSRYLWLTHLKRYHTISILMSDLASHHTFPLCSSPFPLSILIPFFLKRLSVSAWGAWFGPSAAAGRSSTLPHLRGLDKGRWMDHGVGWNMVRWIFGVGGFCCRDHADFLGTLKTVKRFEMGWAFWPTKVHCLLQSWDVDVHVQYVLAVRGVRHASHYHVGHSNHSLSAIFQHSTPGNARD